MSNEKHLLPRVPQYFKANLHTHTHLSDGKLSPQEVKELYKGLGYQVLCITDHNVIVNHSNLNDEDFLTLTGMEINYNHTDYRPHFDGKSFHFNLISKRPDNLWSPWTVRGQYSRAAEYEKLMECEGMELRHELNITNEMIAKANEKGFLVMYNHPTWSCHTYLDYAGLKGLWGMELRNSECIMLGHNENNPRVFKDLLNMGNKVFPVGTDDLHYVRAAGLSWIMVGAEKLTYGSVITALEKGDFYMSCGPVIHSLTVEGNKLKITCSDATQIHMESFARFGALARSENGEYLHEAEFDLTKLFEKGNENSFIYLTVCGPDGSYATTRAYYLNELVTK